MSSRKWFRLAVKAAGLLIIVQTLPGLMRLFVYHLNWIVKEAMSAGLRSYDWMYVLQSGSGDALLVVCGLYLVFRGEWVVNVCAPQDGLCDVCGYNTSRCRGDRCPECGTELPPRRVNTPGKPDG